MSSSAAAFIARVERTVRRQQLFRPGDTLVVAFSGGADSTALLDLLSRLSGYRLHLIAAHLNHCLRGGESDADEQFCRAEAARHGIPFEVRRCNVARLAGENRLNLEDAGRRARIAFLDEVSRKYGATAVALAHHADDQAETVLMRLLRGSGMTGLSGMAYRNDRGYVRPLLDITRAEIEQYLSASGIGWREDASNSDPDYLRNRIRHQLLPLLETYNPSIRSTLASTATLLGDEDTLLEEVTLRRFTGICRVEQGRVTCSAAGVRELKPALRKRVLRLAVKEAAGSLEGVSQSHIEALGDLADSGRPNARCSLPRGMTAVREYDRLMVMKIGETQTVPCRELVIAGPGEYQLPSGGMLVIEAASPEWIPPDHASALCGLDRTPFPWVVRPFRPGDRITPFGMSGRKKVKNIFIDRKIPLSERSRIPLLFSGANLIWVAGVCSSELCRIGAGSAEVVRMTWRT